MIRRILSIIILICVIGTPVITCSGAELKDTNEFQVHAIVSVLKNITDLKMNDNFYALKSNELLGNQQKLLSPNNSKEWFIAYKKLIEEYEEWFDSPETIYDCFTEDEICLMQRTIETECYGLEFDEKCNVASVILNRIYTGNGFGNNVHEVITKPNQFAYGRKMITDDTVLALEYAFQIEGTTDGCIAFKKDGAVNEDWYTWEYVFPDAAGHHFYREGMD